MKSTTDDMPTFPRYRRLRRTAAIRDLVRETTLSPQDFIAPLFVVPGTGIKKEITTLPGQFQFSPDQLSAEIHSLREVGVKTVLLFGIPEKKDPTGSTSYHPQGIVQQAVKVVKAEFKDVLCGVDLCMCEYTSHGHCGVLTGEEVDNDRTLVELNNQALSLADAGADIIAPSGMMDGMILSLRTALDKSSFKDVILMSYSAKYASSFYGPFRDAVNSTPTFGDRRGYQMDPANSDEAVREVLADVEQGADIVMVKPALSYLDIIRRVKDNSLVPVAAYNVSGEYSMIKAAAEKGYLNYEMAMMETLVSIKRAGADIIITYFAKEASKALVNNL